MSQQPMYRLHAFIGRSGSLRAQTNAYIAGGETAVGWDIFKQSNTHQNSVPLFGVLPTCSFPAGELISHKPISGV